MPCPRRALVVVSSSTVLLLASCVSTGTSRQHELERIKLPPGFSIALYTDKVPGARAMTRSPNGTVFVGTMDRSVYALVDTKGTGRADQVVTIARGLESPNGVAFRDGALYVAEIRRVLRFDDIEKHLANAP